MFRATLLYLVCFGIVVVSALDPDNVSAIPICEKKSHQDIYFDLSNKNLTRVKHPFVRGPLVKCINLAGNSIQRLEQEVFDNLPELSYLNLAQNPVLFDNFMKMNFPKLESLVLDGPFELEIDYSDPSSERYRGRRYESLHYISPITLSSLKKLSLRYYGNGPVSMVLDHFHLSNLTHLYMAGNNMREIYMQDTFAESLTHLNIDNSRVKFFSTNYEKLRYLSLDNNEIENVCSVNCNLHSLSLAGLFELEYLSLRENHIESIESDALEDLKDLQTLILDENRISHLPECLFDNTTNLKNLSISYNQLDEVPRISELVKLEYLILDSNQIASVNDSSFRNLPNLRYIGLRGNSLKSLTSGTFDQVIGLKGLDLSWNSITSLPENWISSKIVSMDFVNLEGNDFTCMGNMSLTKLPMIDRICLGSNPMTMSIAEVAELPPTMKINMDSSNCKL